MNKGDRVFSIICLGISLWLILESFKYHYMVKYTPGPGFMPFWIGLILLIFVIVQFVETFRKKKIEAGKAPCLPSKHSLFRVGLIILITAGATLLMNFIGFSLTAILFVSVTFIFLEEINIIKSIITGMVFSICLFFIFQYWMQLELPRGFWSF